MAGFGDNTGGLGLQRAGSIPNGGLRIEAGCWTKSDVSNFVVPTQFNQVVSVIINDGTVRILDVPAVTSAGSICATPSGTCIGEIINYVAFGY